MSLNENQPPTFPCSWCSGVHDLTREIEAIRNEKRCSVSMMQRRFRYGYAHALEVCRQLEARDWLRIVEGGKCELIEKIFLSEQDSGSPATGALSENVSAPVPSLTELLDEMEDRFNLAVMYADAETTWASVRDVPALVKALRKATRYIEKSGSEFWANQVKTELAQLLREPVEQPEEEKD